MRTLCPNLHNEDGLETVLEVPVPEESFDDIKTNHTTTSWMSWMKPHPIDQKRQFSYFGGRNAEIQLLLGVVGAPLVPLPPTPPSSIQLSRITISSLQWLNTSCNNI
ncbi:hypothetical protein L1987_25063 [Smallanthus sonchifolius]|uniref:Uncharacterized protein n=1 Tax=Smallanthus sonchifolius TaxID=185202 RepID=A0ACB9INL7_9ASTR|nr:hypothetical protein L1987_25063 [Smallanthus sonchifolius]